MWRCRQCGSIHCDGPIDLNRHYENYPLFRKQLDYFTRVGLRRTLNFIKKIGLPQKAKILDYGCGAGLLVDTLTDNGFHSYGFDPFSKTHKDESVLKLTFDLVTCIDVIEHQEDPKAVFRQLIDLLRPGGYFLVGTPNADHINLEEPDTNAMALHPPYHRHIMSSQTLIRMGRSFHLSVVKYSSLHIQDTAWPLANFSFFKEYTRKIDNTIDAGFDAPDYSLLVRHPSLIFWGLFGHFFSDRSQMTALFQKTEP